MGQTSMWRLRRLAPRVTQVAERHADDLAVAARAATLLPTLGAFTVAYDQVRRGDIPWARDADSGRRATRDLLLVARMWFPLVVRDLDSLDRANYLDSPISDDLFADTEGLIASLRDGRGATGEPLHYRDEAVGRLEQALRAAHAKWTEAEATDLVYAESMNALRVKATAFRAELEWFTEVLGLSLGFCHPEYLRILPSRAGQSDSADDRSSPLPEIVESATLVTGAPKSLEG